MQYCSYRNQRQCFTKFKRDFVIKYITGGMDFRPQCNNESKKMKSVSMEKNVWISKKNLVTYFVIYTILMNFVGQLKKLFSKDITIFS